MVIAFEGNVHSGKTYFIKQFLDKHKDFVCIPETQFVKMPNPFEQQEYYINEEISKKAKCPSKNILLDRSIISTFIYTQYTKDLTEQNKKILLDKIERAILNKDLFFPDVIYIFLYPFDKIAQNHKTLRETKSTQNILATYDYYCFTLKTLSSLSNSYKIIYSDEDRQILEVRNLKLNQGLNKEITIDSTKTNLNCELDNFYERYVKRKKVDEYFLSALIYLTETLGKDAFSALIKDIHKNIPLISQFKTNDILNLFKNKFKTDLSKKGKTIFLIDIMELIKNYRERIEC